MSNPILTLETNKYAIRLDNFEGPLDLLCHLVDKNKMDIYEVNISEIADQYIEYINQSEEFNLDITSEFLIMASTLLYIKSKHLLPKETEDEAELTEEELIHRIIEYKKYKEISKKLKESYKIHANRFYKLPDKIELPKQKLEREYDNNLLYEKYKFLIERNEQKRNENEMCIRDRGYFLDGKITALFGTHTHVQTADETIMKKGTAYITDIGMTGPKESVIGMNVQASIKRFLTTLPERYRVSDCHETILNGCLFSIEEEKNCVKKIERICLS